MACEVEMKSLISLPMFVPTCKSLSDVSLKNFKLMVSYTPVSLHYNKYKQILLYFFSDFVASLLQREVNATVK